MLVDQSKLKRISEFDLIEKYFSKLSSSTAELVLGVGDDAAILNTRSHEQLVVSTDSLVDGVHFPRTASAAVVAHRALASNLSDMAAMGAQPKWCLLCLNLPSYDPKNSQARLIDDEWLQEFTQQFASLLKQYNVMLIGGDTTSSSELSVSITIMGSVFRGDALRRDGAKVGDDVYVSGYLGEASAGLQEFYKRCRYEQRVQQRFLFPDARVALGLDLSKIASSCIDISDGLLADAQHIAERSLCNIEIHLNQLFFSNALRALNLPQLTMLECVLSGGDDYELLFTAPASQRAHIKGLAGKHKLPLTRIGCVLEKKPGASPRVFCINEKNQEVIFEKKGYEHFVKS